LVYYIKNNGIWVFSRLFMAGYDKVGALGGDDK